MVVVRRILNTEYHKYRTHLKSLDAESKYLRFGYYINDTAIDQLCDKIEAAKHQHILFVVENLDFDFIAVGHIALADGMELAFSVLHEHQNKGIGSALMHRAVQWCRTHGILSGNMVCLSSNTVIKKLCTKHGIKMISEFGETLATIELDSADIGTYIEEVSDSSLATVDFISKRLLRF